MKFRSFIAVPVDADLRQQLQRVADGLRGLDKKDEIRWIPPDNFHLTIAFIGDILQADAVRLESALARSLPGLPPFELALTEVTYFPFNAKPRLVVALVHPDQALQTLHRRVQAGLREVGLPVESRAFVPHVTLGRVKHRRTPWMRFAPQPLLAQLEVCDLSLMRSELDRKGARYSPVWTLGLSASSV